MILLCWERRMISSINRRSHSYNPIVLNVQALAISITL
jgi:hypothetical protein